MAYLRKGFYDEILHQRVLVLVAFDVDALCACKILQYLFQCDQILYTIVPVTGKEELEKAYVENSEGVKHVIFINCGASVDVVETLQPEESVRFYICDSHRPVDVHNVFNAVQVKLLMKEEEFDELPEYDSLFRDDDSDDDSGNDSDTSERSGKRKRFDDEAIEKRRDKRIWDENRQKILFEYNQFSTYGTSASLIMFELAWKMSKDTNDLVWLAVVGVTDQYIHFKTPRDKYIDDAMALESHVARHNHRGDDEDNIISINCLKIVFDEELQLTLYRHWSLFDSICHSVNLASEMGMPLSQCKQKFSSMESTLRHNIKQMIQDHMTKYGLTNQDVVIPSFSAQYGYKNKLCAADYVLACVATLENISKCSFLEKAVELAKKQTQAIVTQVQTFLDMHQVISAGPFLYAFIQEGTMDVKFFAKPQCLMRLARFTLEAHCSVSRNKRAELDEERKNFFGKAFEQAAVSTNSRTLHDSLDSYIMEMKTEDRSKFFDALISLLN
ncbi:CDC45 [Mytilus edulis]|uniref:CDC45 n=1 Tax=Mytilus edulis TaxID=6550 RepID=A0A8S3PVT5_MYTED|nr:CDC45 [Mytilus edulis]